MIVKELWPSSKGPLTVSLTGDDGQDISTFAAEVSVLPKGVEPVALDWLTATVAHPSASVITATFTLDEDTLAPATSVFNVWIRAHSGSTQVIPRIAAQLKRVRI